MKREDIHKIVEGLRNALDPVLKRHAEQYVEDQLNRYLHHKLKDEVEGAIRDIVQEAVGRRVCVEVVVKEGK